MQAIISVLEFPPKESFRILDQEGIVILYICSCYDAGEHCSHAPLSKEKDLHLYLLGNSKVYLVILESLYGMWEPFLFGSPRAPITFPRASRPLLI